MLIKSVTIKNFKSFKDVKIDLGNFNVLVGANASGKSNFLQVFKFIKDLSEFGLDNAIQMQGGIEYVSNINIGKNRQINIELVCSPEITGGLLIGKKGKNIGVNIKEINYKLNLDFSADIHKSFNFIEEINNRYDFVELKKQKNEFQQNNIMSQYFF